MSRYPCIAVIDEREFRRQGLMMLLEPWASIERIRIIPFAPDQTDQWIGGNHDLKMLIFGIGGELLFEGKTLGVLEMLRSRVPNIPLVVISDREDDHDVALAMSKGVQGYISSDIKSALAFQALSFILHGGMYFPLSAVRKLQIELRENGDVLQQAVKLKSDAIAALGAITGATKNKYQNDIWSALTARQRDVLEHIRLGESNKIIGRHLGMTEGTVKVHVRQIMRKVGATNRTQLAVGRTAQLKKVET